MTENTAFAQTTKPQDTPFMTFWLAMNYYLNRKGLPEVLFRDARELWENAAEDAERRATRALLNHDVGGMAHAAVHGTGK